MLAFIEDASAFVTDYCTGRWDRTSPPVTFKAIVSAEALRCMAVVLERTGKLETAVRPDSLRSGLLARSEAGPQQVPTEGRFLCRPPV